MLDKIAKHQDLWIKMLINLGCDYDTAQDITQDMYIKIHDKVKDPKRIMYGDEVNRYYVFITLRNLYFDYLKKRKRSIFVPLMENEDVEEVDSVDDEDNAFKVLMQKIDDVKSELEDYDKILFDLYFMKGFSLRKISKGSNIGLSSIHGSVLKIKQVLRKEISEDLQDYFNEDFDRI